MTTKTKYKFERKGTMPKVGDTVVSTDYNERSDGWAIPHKVRGFRDDMVITYPRKGDYNQNEYVLEEFKRDGCNRVLKRTSN